MKRQIIEDEAVRLAVNEAEARWPRARDSWDVLLLVMANDPEEGEAITESGMTRSLTYQGSKSNGMPSLTVIYEDQDPYVIVRQAKFWEPKKYVPYLH